MWPALTTPESRPSSRARDGSSYQMAKEHASVSAPTAGSQAATSERSEG